MGRELVAEQVVLMMRFLVCSTSAREGLGKGFGLICGAAEGVMSGEDGEVGMREGGGREMWDDWVPRTGERWPGVITLKTMSLEK